MFKGAETGLLECVEFSLAKVVNGLYSRQRDICTRPRFTRAIEGRLAQSCTVSRGVTYCSPLKLALWVNSL